MVANYQPMRTITILRVLCPMAMLAAIGLGAFAWTLGLHELMAVNAFLAGINLMLTWINWRWFQI